MKRIVVILLSSYGFFMAEFFLFNAVGPWWKPDLLLLLVVFFNLYLGIRYGLLCAVWCGILKDVFGLGMFGLNIFIFVSCAFMATLIRKNFYQPGSKLSRLMVTLGVIICSVIFRFIAQLIAGELNWEAAFFKIVFLEMFVTMAVATFVFNRLKSFAVKINL